jgi:molybdopterin guanine dinucleotide-containing S/N-oxide reductase-like protein
MAKVSNKSEMNRVKQPLKVFSGETTVIKALSLGGAQGGGGPCAVDVKDGKIIRIRPFHFDWKYDNKQFNPWKISRDGKTYEPLMKSLVAPFSLGYKKRVYSPNRIKYPLIRVDWDPNGERNPQNRGISKYRRISWEEASDIIASEIRRVQKTYGPSAILLQEDGHSENKLIHASHGCSGMLMHKMGGFTQQVRNPDSWEGWFWGTKHVWGQGWVGMMRPSANLMKDITENAQQVLFWGGDPETTPWGFTGQCATRLCYFWTQVCIKQVYICPDLNYGAAVHADKWIPVLPNTDAALQLAIIYIWIKEGTYDKEYVKTHTVGMDKVEDYVLGKDDNIPKTPEWASKKCGVPEWTIKALARNFASKITSIAHYFGGSYIRGPFSHEPARLEAIMLGMQGLGKPGVHQYQISYAGAPRGVLFSDTFFDSKMLERIKAPHNAALFVSTKQFIPKTLIHKAIMNPPVSFWGTGAIYASVEDQFVKYTYPLPKEEGGSEIHMVWTDSPCRTTCWNCGNETTEAFQSSKIECIVAQHIWLENDCLLADIILPSNTTLEVEDMVTNSRQGMEFQSICFQKQAIQPVGESKSDYEVVLEIAKKLGKYDEVTQGLSIKDMEKSIYESTGMEKYISWEEFMEKMYFVVPVAEDWEKDSPGLRKFYEDPVKNPLRTPTGKLEFYSERLATNFPNDNERPPIPKWIEKSTMHDERLGGSRSKMFPLLVMSNHGRWRVHAQCDDIAWTREAPTCKVKGWDGYLYEPVWIHPSDAAARGILDGDIVKLFNERGSVLCGARVFERIKPGVTYVDHGARVDYIIPGKLDRGGAINTISPDWIISEHCGGQATSGYLIEIEKVTLQQMENWKKEYPEAFAREYSPSSGLCFNAWVQKD